MGVIKRQGIKATIVSYIGIGLGTLNVLFLYPAFLTPEGIGLLRVLVDCAVVFTPFAMLGMGQTLIKFFPEFSDNRAQRMEFLSFLSLVVMGGFGLLLLALYFFQGPILGLFAENSPLLIPYSLVVIPLTLINVYHTFFEQYSGALFRITIPKISRDVIQRFLAFVVVLSYGVFTLTMDQLVMFFTLTYLVNFLILVGYVLSLDRFRPNFKFTIVTKQLTRRIFDYGAFTFLAGAGNKLVSRMDTLMLAALIGLDNTGIYSIAMFIGTVVEMPRRAISRISGPVIAKAFANNNTAKVENIYRKSAINQLIVGAFILMMIWMNIDSIFGLMPKTETYIVGKYVVLFIGLGKLIDMGVGVTNEIVIMSKFYRLNLWVLIFLLAASFTSNLLLIPEYAMNGAALATCLSVFLFNLLRSVIIWVKLKIHPYSRNTFITLAIIAACYALSTVLPSLDIPLLDIAYKSAVISLIYGCLIYFSKASEDMNSLLHEMLKKVGINL